MDKVKISICMPTRNRASFIGAAIESIISQADDSIEIVIVDGASQDNTQEVVQSYQMKFNNLVYLRQEENGGVDRDMAKAIELAHGQYCWLLSDDDALKQGAIRRILDEIESGYEIYLCNITACNLSLKPFKELSWLSRGVQDRVFDLNNKDELIEYCNKANSIGAFFSYWSSIILKKEEWIQAGYAHDFDKSAYALAATLFSLIGKRCRLKYIRNSLILWRNDNQSFQNEGGLAKRFLLDFNGYLKLADKYLSFDSAVRNPFLKVMKREHPWYTVIHAASFIDDSKLQDEFESRLIKFGYSKKLIRICFFLRKYKNLISYGVKIKRRLARNYFLNKFKDLSYKAAYISRRQILQITPLFNYLLIFNIFAGAFTIFRYPFEFYVGYVFILFFLAVYIFRFRSIPINSNFIIALSLLIITSLVNVYLGNNTIFFLTKQVVGILLTGVTYYLLIKFNDFDVEKLFRIYLQFAVIVAGIGIFQEFSYLVKFKIGYDYRWFPLLTKWECGNAAGLNLLRLNSIFSEPAFFAVSISPAFFVSISDILKKKKRFLSSKWTGLIIIVSYILTFSALAYFAILLSILFSLRPKKSIVLAIIVLMPIFLFGTYSLLPDIRMRVNDAIAFIGYPRVYPNIHMSIYSVVSNAFVASKSFIGSFLFGSGLGSHSISYDRFSSLGIAKGFMMPFSLYPGAAEVCKGDSGSLFLRLISETGLLGIILVSYFIFRFRLKIDSNNNLSVINNAVLILFILLLLRQAHYFYNGLFFFVWIYYFSYKIYKHSANSEK